MSCAAFLEVCNGNCTENTAFKDACIVECEDCPDCNVQWYINIVLGAVIIFFIWYYWIRKPEMREKERQEKLQILQQARQNLSGNFGGGTSNPNRSLNNVPVNNIPYVTAVTAVPVLPRNSEINIDQQFRDPRQIYAKYYGRQMSDNEYTKYLSALRKEYYKSFKDDDQRDIDATTLKITPQTNVGRRINYTYPQDDLTKTDIQKMSRSRDVFITHDFFIVKKKNLIITEANGGYGADRGYQRALNQPTVF